MVEIELDDFAVLLEDVQMMGDAVVVVEAAKLTRSIPRHSSVRVYRRLIR